MAYQMNRWLLMTIGFVLFASGCNSAADDWQKALSTNTIEGYVAYEDAHPLNTYSAEIMICNLKWRDLDRHSASALKDFIAHYPTSSHIREAKGYLCQLGVKSIDLSLVDEDRVVFPPRPVLSVKFDQWGQAEAVNLITEPEVVKQVGANELFLRVSIQFDASEPFDLPQTDVELISGDGKHVAPLGVLVENGTWHDPEDQSIAIDGTKYIRWLFSVRKNSDVRSFKVCVGGVDLDSNHVGK